MHVKQPCVFGAFHKNLKENDKPKNVGHELYFQAAKSSCGSYGKRASNDNWVTENTLFSHFGRIFRTFTAKGQGRANGLFAELPDK